MKDKKLEKKHSRLKDFGESWDAFHDLYKKLKKKEHISSEDEKGFLENKRIMERRYMDLSSDLEMKDLIKYDDPIFNVLKIERITALSDAEIYKLDEDWENAEQFLKALRKGFEDRLKRVRGSLGIVNFINKALNDIWGIIIVTIFGLVVVYYLFIKYLVTLK